MAFNIRIIKILTAGIFFFFVFLSPAISQPERKALKAVRTPTPPVIDGSLDDEVWSLAEAATDFFQYEPHNDRAASMETHVKVLYDDQSIYIGAFMEDPAPDSILRELGLRNSGDQLNADRFWVDINPFDDGINGFRFQVSASGVQTDLNMSGAGTGRGDVNWDAVWISEARVHENGWVVEMEIPYSALRFPKGDLQEWGINFWREIRRTREVSSWNFVNVRIGDPLASMGQLEGINGIEPPLRLSFYPYLSGYMEKNGMERGWANTINGGMDVKYGISPSFTMDMTLIPDFGQVQSDALVLNLTPYEVKYDENRQFFTEGTELFGKADLFYSRRIGAAPSGYADVIEKTEENEVVTENPLETRLINATKISGRTGSGLGMGLFNAMTAPSRATLQDTITGDSREVTTQPFTNYNLVVVDQSLRNNSFVSLINTNVAGSADGYTANVTGTEFRLMDRSNMFRFSGSAAVSQQYYSEANNVFGHKYNVSIGKFGGTWQYHYSRSVLSDAYDQNDMGFLRRNNTVTDGASLSYNIFDPFWRLWSFSQGVSVEYSSLYDPNTFTKLNLGYNARILFDTRLFFMLRANYQPRGERDYFEPRAPGRFYESDPAYDFNLMYSTDYRRRIFVDGNLSFARILSNYDQQEYNLEIKPTFRASDQWNLSVGFEYSKRRNDIGYVSHTHNDSVYFGLRQTPTLVNSFRTTYIFNNDLSLDFNLRHYWSRVDYEGVYFFLDELGQLDRIEQDLKIPDINYNAFSIDMMFTWHFAPGSQLTAVWKNLIDSRASQLKHNYMDNLRHIIGESQINSFSVKVLYYLDYQYLQRWTRNI